LTSAATDLRMSSTNVTKAIHGHHPAPTTHQELGGAHSLASHAHGGSAEDIRVDVGDRVPGRRPRLTRLTRRGGGLVVARRNCRRALGGARGEAGMGAFVVPNDTMLEVMNDRPPSVCGCCAALRWGVKPAQTRRTFTPRGRVTEAVDPPLPVWAWGVDQLIERPA